MGQSTWRAWELDRGTRPMVSGVTGTEDKPKLFSAQSGSEPHPPRRAGHTSGRLKLQLPLQARSGHAGPKHLPHAMPCLPPSHRPTAVAAPPRKSSRIGRPPHDAIPARQISSAAENCPLSRSIRCLPCVPSGPRVARRQGLGGRLTILALWKLPLPAVDHGPSPPSLFLVATWKLEGRFEPR